MKLLKSIACPTCHVATTDSYTLLDLSRGRAATWMCGHQGWQCAGCDKSTVTIGYSGGGAVLCSPCAKDKVETCANAVSCGGMGIKPEHKLPGMGVALNDFNGKRYCKGCFDNASNPCAVCNVMGGTLGRMVKLDVDEDEVRRWICEAPDCRAKLLRCATCHTTTLGGAGWHTAPALWPGNPVASQCCPHCWLKYGWCPGCNATAHRRLTGGGVERCVGCRPVLQYNDKAETRLGFLGVPQRHKLLCKDYKSKDFSLPCKCGWDRLFFGVELEVEGSGWTAGERDAAAEKIVDLTGKRVIVKRDGSLSDGGEGGFEIVTAPAPLSIQREIWRPFFDWAPSSGLKAQKTVTCGMHIHVSRAALGNDLKAHWLSIGKIVQFIHEPENRQFVEFMSGRPPGHYQDFMRDKRLFVPTAKPVQWSVAAGAPPDGGMKWMTHPDVAKRLTYSPRRDARSRYTAVNLMNPGTIEFRIFKSTLNPHTFWARFEFVAALVKYCMPTVASIQHMKVPHFAAWLSTQRKDYPDLCDHMVKGAFMDPPPSRKPSPPPVVPVLAPAPRALSGKARNSLRVRKETT